MGALLFISAEHRQRGDIENLIENNVTYSTGVTPPGPSTASWEINNAVEYLLWDHQQGISDGFLCYWWAYDGGSGGLAIDGYRFILQDNAGGQLGALSFNGTTKVPQLRDSNDTIIVESSNPIPVSGAQWIHWVFEIVRDPVNGVLRIFRNGVLDIEATGIDTGNANFDKFRLNGDGGRSYTTSIVVGEFSGNYPNASGQVPTFHVPWQNLSANGTYQEQASGDYLDANETPASATDYIGYDATGQRSTFEVEDVDTQYHVYAYQVVVQADRSGTDAGTDLATLIRKGTTDKELAAKALPTTGGWQQTTDLDADNLPIETVPFNQQQYGFVPR